MGAWIEIIHGAVRKGNSVSHPTMGAWIEISHNVARPFYLLLVAPHDGCVD